MVFLHAAGPDEGHLRRHLRRHHGLCHAFSIAVRQDCKTAGHERTEEIEEVAEARVCQDEEVCVNWSQEVISKVSRFFSSTAHCTERHLPSFSRKRLLSFLVKSETA